MVLRVEMLAQLHQCQDTEPETIIKEVTDVCPLDSQYQSYEDIWVNLSIAYIEGHSFHQDGVKSVGAGMLGKGRNHREI